MRAVALAVFLVLSVTPVLAGAWLRAEGQTFASTGVDLTFGSPRNDAARAYVEYGWRRYLTIGADLFANAQGHHHGFVFLRSALFRNQSRVAVSITGSLGARATFVGPTLVPKPLYRLGIAAGVPFRKGANNGWASAELTFEHQSGTPGLIRKVDATFGMTFSPRWQGLVDLGLARGDAGFKSREITPRAAYRLNDKTRLVFGLKAARTGTTRTRSLGFDIWREF